MSTLFDFPQNPFHSLPENERPSVLIVDDLVLVCHSLKMLLHQSGHYKEIWQAHNGKEACELVKQFHPDVVLMDIEMPVMDGLEASRQIKKFSPATKIIIQSATCSLSNVNEAMKIGVNGFCSKSADFQQLQLLLNKVLKGGIGLDLTAAQMVKELNAQVSQELPASVSERIHTSCLNHQELTLLSLIADYHSNEEIADILKLSSAWIGAYIQTILTKLGVETEAQAIRIALEDGVIERSRMVDQDFAI